MKIGVLETGPVVPELEQKWGSYGDFFDRLLSQTSEDFHITPYVCHQQDIPKDPHAQNGWIISGSKHGAYDPLAWIPPLEDFLRQTYAASVPIVGVCFGHQILAQALGGKVVKSEKGWGLGVQKYQITGDASWAKNAAKSFAGHAIHQDQVIEKPTDAQVWASSDFCPMAALTYGDPANPTAISVQPHPEFDADFVADLIEARRGSVFDGELADKGLASLSQPVDNDHWSQWIVNFFENSIARRQAA